jgi:hypothetical protein
MSEQEKPVLSDRQIYPTDEYIFSIIGPKKELWLRIMNHMKETYKDSSGDWNYYNDGKQWLFKMVNKKKTVFWSGILSDTFRITFYLGNKAEPVIESSDLPPEIKEEFHNAKRYGLIRPVSFIVRNNTDVDNVLKMIVIKNKIK